MKKSLPIPSEGRRQSLCLGGSHCPIGGRAFRASAFGRFVEYSADFSRHQILGSTIVIKIKNGQEDMKQERKIDVIARKI